MATTMSSTHRLVSMESTTDSLPHQTTDDEVGLNEDEGSKQDSHSDLLINACLVAASVGCLVFSTASCVAMCRTKRIPKTARVLSFTLIIFDCATTFTYALRKLITHSQILNILTLIGIGWSFSSYLNVAFMALERLVVFQWPYFYVRHSNSNPCFKAFLLTVTLYLVAWTGEWSSCFLTTTKFWDTRRCLDPVVTKYMTATFSIAAIVSCVCFYKIVAIIVKQKKQVHSLSETAQEQTSSNHRSTFAVFFCCLNYIVVAMFNLVLVYTLDSVTIVVRRTILDILYITNGFVDTLVYVLWYRECRYELVKMLSRVLPSLQPRVEKMRLEIFDIQVNSQTNENDGAVKQKKNVGCIKPTPIGGDIIPTAPTECTEPEVAYGDA